VNVQQRTDLFVGSFLIATVAVVVTALVATSGWGVDRYDLYVRTDNAQDITVDTRIFMQGLEVGRVAEINPHPAPDGSGRLVFILRLSLLDKFPDGTPLRLPRGTDAEVTASLLGGSQVQLTIHGEFSGLLDPGDTIDMHRSPAAMEAFGALARDLKGTIEDAIVSATATLRSTQRLAESLTVATGTARRFVAGIQGGTEKSLTNLATSLDRVRLLLDSTNARTELTFREVNSAIRQGRTLMASADSLTNLLVAMGGENRPEMRQIIVNLRDMSRQMQYVLEQLGRRPMRVITGVKLPDSLSVERRAATDSTPRASSEPRP
jgi:ABC-type transporter Mla subunit MlaD